MSRWVFYAFCDGYGEEGVRWCDEAGILHEGGVKAFEKELRATSRWYSRLGELELPSDVTDDNILASSFHVFRALSEEWIEKGAPRTAGDLATGDVDGELPNCVVKYFVYRVREKDGREELACRTEAEVAELGGIEGVETALRRKTAWYYPIGVLLCSSWIKTTSDKTYLPFRRLKALVDDWLAQGSPWKRGDHAEEGEVPPKGQPLNAQ